MTDRPDSSGDFGQIFYFFEVARGVIETEMFLFYKLHHATVRE
jgi:hypothetical protein